LFGAPNDRLLMSVLRAWSDAVVIGRGTFMADPPVSTWHWKTTAPSAKRPGLGEELQAMERALGSVRPHVEVIVTTRGENLDFARKLFRDPDVHAVVASTREGAKTVRTQPGAAVEIWELGNTGNGVDLAALLSKLYELGRKRVLVEGGPQLYGALESIGRVDEIFLTHRAMTGGTDARTPRPTFSGVAHEAPALPRLDLVSVRTAPESSTLFTRWRYR
jgi:riboflavin biosynthesis pyrimidine reductase